MPQLGALGHTFTFMRVMQFVSLVTIIGLTSNFISEMVSADYAAPSALIGTLVVVSVCSRLTQDLFCLLEPELLTIIPSPASQLSTLSSPTFSTGTACSLFSSQRGPTRAFSSLASSSPAQSASPSATSRAPSFPQMATRPTLSTPSSTTSTTPVLPAHSAGSTPIRPRATRSRLSGVSALPYASFLPFPPSSPSVFGSAPRVPDPSPRILRVEGAAVGFTRGLRSTLRALCRPEIRRR